MNWNERTRYRSNNLVRMAAIAIDIAAEINPYPAALEPDASLKKRRASALIADVDCKYSARLLITVSNE